MNNNSLYLLKLNLDKSFAKYLNDIDNLINYYLDLDEQLNVKLMILSDYREKIVQEHTQLKKGLSL